MDLSTLERIRKIAIIAMFSDDMLMDLLVLKGGNAIAFFYCEYFRSSIDLDFSLAGDIRSEDIPIVESRIQNVLERTFREHGFKVFDYKFLVKPKVRKNGLKDFWGGYQVTFKMIEEDRFKSLGDDMDNMRKVSLTLGSEEKKAFTIDISKCEFCGAREEKDFDGYTIFVYSPEMLVIEKIRAICQQMPEYPFGEKCARARDFFDIHILMETQHVVLTDEENLALFKLIFEAKEVPLHLIKKIPEFREFHAKDFYSVEATVPRNVKLQHFDYYFDYLIEKTRGLEILWKK